MEDKKSSNISTRLSGFQKLLLSLLAAILLYSILSFFHFEIMRRIILAWDMFCISMITFCWILFFTTSEKELPKVVARQDDGLKVIFVIVLVAICFSVFGTLILLTGKSGSTAHKILQVLISMSPVFFSWILLHSVFAIRYAHLYHDRNLLNTGNDAGGIEFPCDTPPDYIDFTYFSFVIGMTFQVSDTTVSSRAIRRFVLMHSIISFAFNTIIVALTINTISNLRG
jgi:uncharacterized membrane protein